MHVITPSDLLKFQIDHYSEMLEKPRFEGQERFLNNEINKLYGNRINNMACSYDSSNNKGSKAFTQRMERIKAQDRL
jgi:hypothetical protein